MREPSEVKLLPTSEIYVSGFSNKKVGIKLNPNEAVVNGILKAMVMKKQKQGEHYCPCRVVTGDLEKDKEEKKEVRPKEETKENLLKKTKRLLLKKVTKQKNKLIINFIKIKTKY